MGKPKIRFKGYTDDWEQRKLPEFVSFFNGLTYTPDDVQETGTLVLRSSNVKNGEIVDADNVYVSDEVVTSENVKEGDIIVVVRNGSRALIGKHAQIKASMPNTVIGAFMSGIRSEHSSFVNALLDTSAFENEIAKSMGATINQITGYMFSKMEFMIPSGEEQDKIGAYFKQLDHLITLHQRKCEETKKLKKYMLQKMFPQNGQVVPEIRFSGFTDDWEQRKLDDWGDFYYGRSCPKWSVTEDATIPCIRYGELYTKFGAKIDRVYSYTNIPPENLRFSKGTEVLIPRVGEDPMDYNHCTWLSMPDIAIGEMISVFNTDNNPLFTATMFNATLQNEFAMRVEGGSVTNLYFEKLKNIEVSFPSIPEQEKIAAYFADLDHLITLHQNKCDELKKIKKFMLQNMFV